jgi:hypothetical protein
LTSTCSWKKRAVGDRISDAATPAKPLSNTTCRYGPTPDHVT